MIVKLHSGSQISIRPIEPKDRAGLSSGIDRLSLQSRYQRFFVPVNRLQERDLTYLTLIDHHDHEALLAFDEDSGVGVAVARYVRTSAAVAEPAIVVVDEWQRRGVGSALIAALVQRARNEGIVRFEAPVLASNGAAIRLFERIGPTDKRPDGPEVKLIIELCEDPPATRREAELRRRA